jgi:hypothetical protein
MTAQTAATGYVLKLMRLKNMHVILENTCGHAKLNEKTLVANT